MSRKKKPRGRPPKKKPPGRKTKLNQRIVNDAQTAAAMGLSMNLVSDFIGIPLSTMYDWIRRGAERPGSIYEKFSEALSRGRSQCAMKNMARIQEAGATDWRAAAWVMEKRFGFRSQIDINTEYVKTQRRAIESSEDVEALLATLTLADGIRGQIGELVIHEDEDEGGDQ
ncbi:hypothetical protein [Sulfitobacter dubius]|uniref:hypothetical protein n=1 Tax=Sulfitobacter dubius TaxID=218673 RepID=UPI0030DCE189|tara:strand:+ start:43 stop:552 length:510 start_codon:yes stop_codon:yes gene_type:complete